jgi:hypothetical protein
MFLFYNAKVKYIPFMILKQVYILHHVLSSILSNIKHFYEKNMCYSMFLRVP